MKGHHLHADADAFGLAAYLMATCWVRQMATESDVMRKICTAVLEDSADDAELAATEMGREAAALIRRVLEMTPFAGAAG